MKLTYHTHTDVGRKRTENQDSYGIIENRDMFIVCDGMGGGAAGDFASRAAVQVLATAFDTLTRANLATIVPGATTYDEDCQRAFASIRLANRTLSNLSEKYPKLKGMGTTIVACLINRPRNLLHIFHVGDSRLYRLRGKTLELLTYDHSKINELVEAGKMTTEEAKHSEIQSMITRALGTQPVVRIDYKAVPIEKDDRFILCTDGLNGEIDDLAIREIFIKHRASMSEVCTNLIDAANAAAGRDNTTVIALHVEALTAHELMMPLKQKPEMVYTLEAETATESSAEDALLRTLMQKAGVSVPESAIDRNIVKNPLVLGLIFTVIMFVGVGIISSVISRAKTPKQTNVFANLEGKICALAVEVRTPTAEQYRTYKASDDMIVRMQLVQDWYKDTATNTVPLAGAAVTVEKNQVLVASGTAEGTTYTATMPPGMYDLTIALANYKLITEKLDSAAIPVTAEYAPAAQMIVLIMIPE